MNSHSKRIKAKRIKAKQIKPRIIARSRVEELYPGLIPKTLANLNSLGKGPPGFKRGRLVFYRCEDIEDYLLSNPI